MTIKGTLIDSTIFHTSDQLMESIVDVLFQFRNPASQSQISSLSIPVCVSIDMGRRRPEGRWEPPPPIQPHGRPCAVGPRAFCRIRCTICRVGGGAVPHARSPPYARQPGPRRAATCHGGGTPPPRSRSPSDPHAHVNPLFRALTRYSVGGQACPRSNLRVNVRVSGPTLE